MDDPGYFRKGQSSGVAKLLSVTLAKLGGLLRVQGSLTEVTTRNGWRGLRRRRRARDTHSTGSRTQGVKSSKIILKDRQVQGGM